MVGATKWEGAGTALLACGYGVTCGLVFPLMVQSVFLHEIGLAHGAGESFGLLFFIAYSVTMLVCAAFFGLAAGSGDGRMPLLIGLAAAFAGNALMLAHSFGLVADGWPYAVAAACLIGCGLALGELGWARTCAAMCNGRPMMLSRAVSGSYLAGTAVSAAVFALSGAFELVFALLAIAVSAALLPALRKSPALLPSEERSDGSSVELARSTVYLAVFSFVFGAVGQAGAAAGGGAPVQVLALAGMGLAAAIALGATAATRRVEVYRFFGHPMER